MILTPFFVRIRCILLRIQPCWVMCFRLEASACDKMESGNMNDSVARFSWGRHVTPPDTENMELCWEGPMLAAVSQPDRCLHKSLRAVINHPNAVHCDNS